MFRWEFAILETIYSLGGEACLQEIYAHMEEHYLSEPEEKHTLRATKWQDRPAYQHTVRSRASALRRKGQLVWVKRACYALAESGFERYVLELSSYDPEAAHRAASRRSSVLSR